MIDKALIGADITFLPTELMDAVNGDGRPCAQLSIGGFCCTRDVGHERTHVACGMDTIHDVWEDAPGTEGARP